MKTCSKCGASLPLAQFDVKKQGVLRAERKGCRNARYRQRYANDEEFRLRVLAEAAKHRRPYKEWTQEAKDAHTQRNKRYKQQQAVLARAVPAAPIKHDAHVRAHAEHKKMARINGQKHSAHVTAWRRCRPGAYWRHRYRTDHEFNAREKVKARLRRLDADSDLQRHMAQFVKANRLPPKWEALLGYSMSDLVRHLHRTLPKGSRYDQFLDGSLHIDHILPRSSFDMSSVDEVKACWSLGNLRLLPAQANMRKGAAVETLL